jgi:hypothetical protein
MTMMMGSVFFFVVLPFWLAVSVVGAFHQPACSRHHHPLQQLQQQKRHRPTAITAVAAAASSASSDEKEEVVVVDVVVIGAGIGGLCCAAVSALYGHNVLCVEAHDTPGGVAHSFRRRSNSGSGTFEFDSGPSLLSGMSSKGTNPLRQVLDALDVADLVQWKEYDGWVIHDTSSASSSSATKDGTQSSSFKLTTGTGGMWEQAVEDYAGISARREFETLRDQLLQTGGLSEA